MSLCPCFHQINLLNGKVLTVPALYVPPAYQGTAGGSDVARAALHLITTLALGMGVQRIKFLQVRMVVPGS